MVQIEFSVWHILFLFAYSIEECIMNKLVNNCCYEGILNDMCNQVVCTISSKILRVHLFPMHGIDENTIGIFNNE